MTAFEKIVEVSIIVHSKGYLEEAKEEDRGTGKPEEEDASTAIVGRQDQPALQRCGGDFVGEILMETERPAGLEYLYHVAVLD